LPLDLPPGSLATGALVSRARSPRASTRILLAILVAVVAGLASGGLIAAQRADRSVDRFVDWYRPEDRLVVTNPGLPAARAIDVLGKVGRQQQVVARQRFAVIVVRAHLADAPSARGAMVGEAPIDPFVSDMTRFRVLHGRLADPRRADEVVVDEDLARLLGLHVGQRFSLDLFGGDQIDAIGNGRVTPPRSTVGVTVAGIIRRPQDLEHDPEAQPDNLAEFNDAFLATTPAFWAAHGPDLASYGFRETVRLPRDPTARHRFIASFDGRTDATTFPADVFHDPKVVQRSVSTEAVALAVFALVVAVVGFVLVGTQVRRAVAVEPDDRATLAALGVGRNEVAIAELLRAAPIVIGGALASVAVAVVLAPRLAFGQSRRAELGGQTGSAFALAALFALVVMVGGFVAVTIAARAAGRTGGREAAPRREGSIVGWMTRRGLPPWSVAGVRMARPPRGRRGAAARSAQLTIGVGVALLVATVTFGTNLHHLVTSPSARGWMWDVEAGNFSRRAEATAGRRFLAADPDVATFTGYGAEQLPIDGHVTDVLGIEEPPLSDIPVLRGRLPSSQGEIALTSKSLRTLGRDVGDEVTISADLGTPKRFRIVGASLGPGAVDQSLDLRQGAIVRASELAQFIPQSVPVNRYLVRFKDGIDEQDAIRRLHSQFGLAVFHSTGTSSVASVQRIQPLLVLLAATVLLLAAGTLVHALGAAVRRHRRELAVLKALGLGRTQTSGAVVLQSVTIAAWAMVVGVPVGLIIGRWAWTVAASTVGVLERVSYPAAVLLAIVAVLIAAAATGLPSAARARRVPVAEALRTE
jgi:ABC-type lipoprotein release transport system permease subunit